jgi:hypothetical protein
MRVALWSALCAALPAAVLGAIPRHTMDEDLRRLERDVAGLGGDAVQQRPRADAETAARRRGAETAEAAASSQAALGVEYHLGDGFKDAELIPKHKRGGWVPPRDRGPGAGAPPNLRAHVMGESMASQVNAESSSSAGPEAQARAEAKLAAKYEAFADQIKAYARALHLPAEPCADFKCFTDNMEKLADGEWGRALSELNDNQSASSHLVERTMMAKLEDYREETKVYVASLAPHKDRRYQDVNLMESIKSFETGLVNDNVGKRKLKNLGKPDFGGINSREQMISSPAKGTIPAPGDRITNAMLLVEQGEGEGEGEGEGDASAARDTDSLGDGIGALSHAATATTATTAAAATNPRTARTGMSNAAFRAKIFRAAREASRVLPEIFYVGGGANVNALSGSIEAAVDFETYEAAVFTQAGAVIGTDLGSLVGGNVMAGVAWKRSKSGESIEEYGGPGVYVELGGDVELTVSVVAEIDASAQFAPEWDGVLKIGGDIGLDFGIPTGVAVNVGASSAAMIRRSRTCCATRRCLAYKIFMMPGSSFLKASAYAALAAFPPPSSPFC